MNEHEPLLKPLVLDLLSLVERTLSLAKDSETTMSQIGSVAQAGDLIRAALDVLPFAEAADGRGVEELESLPPALPSEATQIAPEEQFAADAPPPANDWLLGDDDGFGMG